MGFCHFYRKKQKNGKDIDWISSFWRSRRVSRYNSDIFEKKICGGIQEILHLKFLMKDTSCPAILSPSGLIDKVWHTHLLMPNNYAKFCQSVFGQIIDHDLAGSKSPENEKSKRWVSLIYLRFIQRFKYSPIFLLTASKNQF